MQLDARSDKKETPLCVNVAKVVPMDPVQGMVQERKRKEFLRRGATRRRMLARCFGGGLFFILLPPFSPLAFIHVYVCVYMCMHVCI